MDNYHALMSPFAVYSSTSQIRIKSSIIILSLKPPDLHQDKSGDNKSLVSFKALGFFPISLIFSLIFWLTSTLAFTLRPVSFEDFVATGTDVAAGTDVATGIDVEGVTLLL